MNTMAINGYYVNSNNNLYFYVEGTWLDCETFFDGLPFGGIVTSVEEMSTDGIYAQKETSSSYYKFENASWVKVVKGTYEDLTNVGITGFYSGELTIPKEITNIKAYAFADCRYLTRIVFEDINSLIDVSGLGLFKDCFELLEVEIPPAVGFMGNEMFSHCYKLSSFKIPERFTSIPDKCFEMCSSLKDIIIPKSITTIYDSAFRGCSALTDVYYTGTEEEWNAITFGSENEALTNATKHFNYVEE